jgi:hypothetical protein
MSRIGAWYLAHRVALLVVLIVVVVLAAVLGFWTLWSMSQSFVNPNTVAQKTDFIQMVVGIVSGVTGLIGGLVLVVGLLLNFRGQNQNQRNTLDQFELTRRGQVTEHFTKAIEQLGENEKRDVRLGGIYALKQIAEQQTQIAEQANAHARRLEILDILASYVREHATYSHERRPPRADYDIEAVLKVIKDLRKRYKPWEDGHLVRLGYADLLGVDISDMHLEGASLENTYLTGAVLRRTYLGGAYMQGAHLENADLSGAHLELADLRGAHLQGANLSNAKLMGARLEGADIQATNFQGALLRGALPDGVRENLTAFWGMIDPEWDKATLEDNFEAYLVQEQIEQAFGNNETVLPGNVEQPEWWDKLPNLSSEVLLSAGNYSIILGKSLMSFTIDDGWYAQFGLLPYTFSLSPTGIGHAGPQLTFVQTTSVFDPEKLEKLEPEKYRKAIQRDTPDISWFKDNVCLELRDSKERQDSVGDPALPGAQVDVSVRQGNGKDIPGYHETCIPLLSVGRIWELASLEGNKTRIIVLNAEGESMIILVESPAQVFETFLEKTTRILKSVRWPDQKQQREEIPAEDLEPSTS